MAYYRTRPDGLLEVVQDDGSTSPGLPPGISGSLEAEGILAQQPPPELGLGQSGATAGLDIAGVIGGSETDLQRQQRQQLIPGAADVQGALQQQGIVQPAEQPRPTNLVGGESSGAPSAPDPREQTAAEVMAEMQRGTRRVAARPERDVLVGYTEQGRAPLPEEQMQARRENLSAQTAETRWQGELAGERLDREQFAGELERAEQIRQLDRERELQERREVNIVRLKAEADQAQKDIQSVNPQEYWDEMGGGSRFMAILAVAMGGFAAGFSGSGRNTALEMLQQSIRDNIDAQKTKIGQQEARHSESRAAYERALEAAGGDEQAADLIYSAGLSRVFAEQAKAYAAEVDSDIMRSQAEQTALQMEELAAEKEAELMGLNRVRAAQFAHQEAQAGGVIRPTYEQALERVGKRHDLEEKVGLRGSSAPLDREDLARRVVLQDGTPVFAKDAKAATENQDTLDALEEYERLGRDTMQLLGKPLHGLSPSERERIRTNGTKMGLAVRRMEQLGVITDSDVSVFMEPLSAMNAEKLTSIDSSVKARLEQNIKLNDAKRAQVLRQLSRDPQMTESVTPRDRLQGGARRGW